MNPNKKIKLFSHVQYSVRESLTIILIVLCSSLISSCGSDDAKLQIKKFCAQVKSGESIMNIVARAGKMDFDKYWLEKFDKEPLKGEVIGIIRSRDLEKKTEKLKKFGDPKTWHHGQFKAMIQELGYSRHVCSVEFARDKVLKKEVLSVD